MARIHNLREDFVLIEKKSSIFWALGILLVLIMAPIAIAAEGGIISGTIYNSNGYPLGGANVELYNYINTDTPYSISPLQSENLLETQRTWATTSPLYSLPSGVNPSSPRFSNSQATTTLPNNLQTTNNPQNSNALQINLKPSGIPSSSAQVNDSAVTSTAPSGSVSIALQNADSLATNTQPLGNLPAISNQISDSGASNTPPLGTSAAISPQGSNTTSTFTPPSGSVNVNSQSADSTANNTQPSGTSAISSQNSNSTSDNSAPLGSVSISYQTSNTTVVNSQPGGTAGINSQNANTSSVNSQPSGSAGISEQISNSTDTNTQPSGSAAISSQIANTTSNNTIPSGLANPSNRTSDATQTFTQPTGSVTISVNSAEAGSTTTNPGNAPGSKSGTWYNGTITIEVGDDGNGVAEDIIYWVLTDNVTSGVYNIMNLSYNSNNFNEGDTSDQVVDTANDEGISDGEIVTFGTYQFNVNFTDDPASSSPDIWINSTEWYTGSFNIDLDGDGSILAGELLNYTLSDSNSDGIYDTIDMTSDNGVFGEGVLNDNQTASANDERTNIFGLNVTFETYLFSVFYWENPNTATPDCAIGSKEWYNGTFLVDGDNNGVADETLNFVLSDMNSDGLYDTMDLSADTTYGEGLLSDGNVTGVDDERITALALVNLGMYLEYEIDFDAAPNLDSNDAQITSNEWYEGTFTIDGDGDGAVEVDNVYYVLSDTDSDGVYDTMDISIGDEDYGELDLGDKQVDFSTTDNQNDEQITASENITLGVYFMFSVEFDGSVNLDSDDARITSVEWYEGNFTIDAEGDGVSDDLVYFVLSDTDSDGIYEAMDISIGDEDYGEGIPNNNLVDFHATDNSDDERITITTDVTLGNYYLFTMEFDSAPNTDSDDARITRKEWYEGTFTIDSDDDGVADNTLYYVLSDTNSNGTYYTMDISLDTTYGQGNLFDENVTASDDEQISSWDLLTLGSSLEFAVEFDSAPNSDSDDARIRSNEWYKGTFTIDGDGDGAVEANNVYYVLSDSDSDGVYDTMDISMGDEEYGEGNLGNATVDFSIVDNLDDERITSSTDITLGDFFLFTVDFDGAPNMDSQDAKITSKEWYEGTFIIDADGDGAADNSVYFVFTDSDSDGIYEVMDLSIGDKDFGEPNVGDGIVDFDVSDNTNDEQISSSQNITLGDYRFTVEFDGSPNSDLDDSRIFSITWWEGTFTIDSDSDGLVDDTFYFVLSDSDSDGVYDTMDMSVDTTYGQGALANSMVTSGDDERISGTQALNLGDTLQFIVEFDSSPKDSEDARITSNEWYIGTFSIDGDGDGTLDTDCVKYVLTDVDSDGIYEAMDISIGDEVYGENGVSDFIVDYGVGNNLNDERISSKTNITLGDYFLFSVEFDSLPNEDVDDARISIIEWYTGSFLIDADGNGVVDNDVYFVLTDSDSDGLYDVMDMSIGDLEFGEGGLSNKTVDFDDLNNTDDERIFVTTNITLGGYFLFSVEFDAAPNSDINDAGISILMWFETSFVIDADSDGIADDTVYIVISDSDSDSNYDTLDISIEDQIFGETISGTLSDDLVNILGAGDNDNDERIDATSNITLGDTLQFTIEFNKTPPTGISDVSLLISEWYEGDFELDADDINDDGIDDDLANYVLTDLDSDGLYDIMDISINDVVFGEGAGLSDTIIDYDTDSNNENDERILASTNLRLGDSMLFSVEFDNNPASSDGIDANITSIVWYTGAFTIDVNGDGILDVDGMKYALTDNWARGLFNYYMEITTDNDVFSVGNLVDGRTGIANDERIWVVQNITLNANRFYVEHFDGLNDGNDVNDGVTYDGNDMKITITQWYFGSANIEGKLRNAVVVDTDSDGIYEDVYIDLNDDGDFADLGVDVVALSNSDAFQSPELDLDYEILSVNPNGRSFEIAPIGASLGSTSRWFFGRIEAPKGSGDNYIVLLSDTDGDTIFETADFDSDLPTDGLVDIIGITETTGLVNLGGTDYQVVNIEDLGTYVRITSFITVILNSNNDISLTNDIRMGIISEADLTINLNQDGDMTDTFYTILVDNNIPGEYETVFIDCDYDYDLSAEMPLLVGDSFSITASAPFDPHTFELDLVDLNGDFFRFKQTNHPEDTFITDSDGNYELIGTIDGSFWISVSNSNPLWGYETLQDTNSEKGYYLENGDTILDLDYYLTQSGNFIFGFVNDSISGTPLGDVMVEVYDSLGNFVVSTQTNSNGSYQVAMTPGSNYDIVFTFSGYHTDDGRTTGSWQDLLVSSDTYSVDVLLVPDTLPPTITIDSPIDSQTVSGTFDIYAEAVDDHLLESVEVSFDLGATYQTMSYVAGDTFTFSWDTTLHAEGTIRVLCRATDFAGNSQTDYIDCYVTNDAETPSVSIVSPQNQEYIDGIYTILIAASDNNALEYVNITLDLVTYETTYNPSSGYYEYILDSTLISEGLHTISAQAVDYAGNSDSDSLLSGFYSDNNVPTLVVFSPLNGEVVSGTSVFLDVDSADPGPSIPTVEYKIDSGAWTTLPGTEALGWAVSWNSNNVTNGIHQVTYRSYDDFGHVATDSITFTVDNDDPTVQIVAPLTNEYIEGAYTFKVLAYDDVLITSVYITFDATDYDMTYNAQSGLWEVTLDSTLFLDGMFGISATCEDQIPSHTQTTASFDFYVDNNAPTLSINSPSNNELVWGNSVSISVDSTDLGISVPTVEYKIDSGAWIVLSGSEIMGWSETWDTTSFANGMHTISFRSYDDSGKMVSESIQVTVDNDSPLVAIVAPLPLENIQNTYNFQVTASDEIEVSNVYVTINTVDYPMGYNGAKGLWEVVLDTTSFSDGVYQISATAEDGIPSHTQTTASINFNIDNNEPTLEIISPSSGLLVFGSSVSIDVNSTDSGPSSPQVQYKIDSGAWIGLSGSEVVGWSGLWDSTGVSNGMHTISFRSYDDIGNIVSDSIMVTVDNDNPQVSVVAPALNEYIQGTYVFKIYATDNVAITNVFITINSVNYIAGYNSASGMWEVALDTTTLSDGTYGITATAEDGILSHTQTTASLSFNIDNNAPSLSINSPLPGELVFGSTISIDASSQDPGPSVPQVQYRIDSGAWKTLAGSEAVGWTDSWDSTTVSSGIHTLSFRSYDTIGNIVLETVEVTVDNDNPIVSIATPVLNEYIKGTYTFSASAYDSVLVSEVFITVFGSDYYMAYNSNSGFWEIPFDTKSVSDGTYQITATVNDQIPSHTQTTSSLEFNVDNNEPELYILSPIEGEHVRGSVSLNLLGIDTFLDKVQYSVDGAGWVSNSTIWNTIFLKDGPHSISVRATDLAGHTVMQTITVIVDNQDTDSDGIGDLEDPDIDGDGIPNESDVFPEDDEEWQDTDSDGIGDNADSDDDGDGVADLDDDFPLNQNEWLDSDFDGIGDNADNDDDNDGTEDASDAFPYDPQESQDTDLDGVGNVADLDDDNDGVSDTEDVFDLNPNEHSDSDLDGKGDNADLDDDNDGYLDSQDAFPYDDLEWQDTDSDGIGNIADLDDDGDGVLDLEDDFPLNPDEYIDSDLDGIGDSADSDDDGDGHVDVLDAFPKNSQEWMDSDSDGTGNNADSDDDGDGISDSIDDFPLDPLEYLDSDEDGVADGRDEDIDGDGFNNHNDAFPYNPGEWADFDMDGIGDKNDTDLDGDGVDNVNDAFDYIPTETNDFDLDGIGDNSDFDDDGDGIPDVNDAFPLNPAETIDTDSDGIGDNSDSDIDGDGYENNVDDFPTISNEYKDSDSDGIGDNADADDDNDGVVDSKDYYPFDKNSQLEPFWWWWILISALVLLLCVVIFITNKRPSELLGPEEKYKKEPERVYTQPAKPILAPIIEEPPRSLEEQEKDLEMEEEMSAPSEEEIECPACGMSFMVEIGDLPTEIKCPYCGVTGALD